MQPGKIRYKVRRFGIIRAILRFFIDSPLTPLVAGASIILGLLAVLLLPREEEPQITVPMIDVFVGMPGASAKEVEQRITKPLEKLLWELPGVEYLYSTASPGGSLTVARFLVGWDEEDAIVQLNQKLYSHYDLIPPGASRPLIKPRRIDDVPILALTLHGAGYDSFALRRIAASMDDQIKQVQDVSETTLIGGQRREVRVELDTSRLTSYQIDPSGVLRMLEGANQQSQAGSFPSGDEELIVETGGFLHDAEDVASVVVGVHAGQLVYLRDIATIHDGPEEPTTYVLFGKGTGSEGEDVPVEQPAVTISVAKRKDTNAIDVANRFSIGILVDDPIVNVENIVRYFRMPESRDRSLPELTIDAVNEVLSPLILATMTVIAAVVPMAFVQGLMGPYMRPIPVGATAAMLFSMAVSFVVTPWAAYRMLRWHAKHGVVQRDREEWTTRAYRWVMAPMIHHPWRGAVFLITITLMLLASLSLIGAGAVKVKMLPFDNKSEFQVVVNMDEGTTLEHTAQVTRELAELIRDEPEVVNYQIYVGTSAPYNFNGLVRHYFLRQGPNVADIQVNLVPKDERALQSHDIAKRVRDKIRPIAERYGARTEVAEVPPGPPVLQTLVAEVYGPRYDEQIENARMIRDVFEQTPGVVDVDWYMEANQPEIMVRLDHRKAALHGIQAEQIAQVVKICEAGAQAGLLHVPDENEDVPIRVRMPIGQRSSVTSLLPVPLASPQGPSVPLGELVHLVPTTAEKSIYHKNLLPVVYVTGDVSGEEESPVYAILKLNKEIEKLKPVGSTNGKPMEIWTTRQPFSTNQPSMKWDGEWHITYEVFRDLGAAFAVVLVLIYTLVVGWFRSFRTPFIIMAAIPFSLVGILPAHWAMGAFFTATSMIGFIAGAGIVVRNSIILVDFIKLRVKQGMPLAEAVIDAGAVRFRPMMLTAAAVVVGGSVILFDPIFQGLAISLMAGEVASLLLSRMAVPIIYHLAMMKQPQEEPASV